ncbi:uncharacterized protein VTP21DRAFT_1883 [Calcarisporiella thermophila]|uniref:uncharacterized protein n=1 Tax=Calcarisporiella thermophila TaxID=911321 RepID=UPI00374409EB
MDSVKNWISVKKYQYELVTVLYMLEPWEKAIFNSVAFLGLILTIYTCYAYARLLPDYLASTYSFFNQLLY